jgi:hypothetical protein
MSNPSFFDRLKTPASEIAVSERLMSKAAIMQRAAGGDKNALGVGLVFSNIAQETAGFTAPNGTFNKNAWAKANGITLPGVSVASPAGNAPNKAGAKSVVRIADVNDPTAGMHRPTIC